MHFLCLLMSTASRLPTDCPEWRRTVGNQLSVWINREFAVPELPFDRGTDETRDPASVLDVRGIPDSALVSGDRAVDPPEQTDLHDESPVPLPDGLHVQRQLARRRQLQTHTETQWTLHSNQHRDRATPVLSSSAESGMPFLLPFHTDMHVLLLLRMVLHVCLVPSFVMCVC